MKKLEKMTLKKMKEELTVISPNELSMVIGGGSDTPPSVDYCLGQIENAFSPITTGVNNTLDAMSSAANAVGNTIENVVTSPITGVVTSIAVDLYMLINGLGTPSPGPTVLPSGDGSGYGINPYISSSSNSDFYKNGFYDLNSDVWNSGNPGGGGNNNNELQNY